MRTCDRCGAEESTHGPDFIIISHTYPYPKPTTEGNTLCTKCHNALKQWLKHPSIQRYTCDSKIIQGKPCPHNCVISAPFRPVTCIKQIVAEYWTAEGETSDRLCPQCRGPAKVTGVSERGGEDIQCPKCGLFHVTPSEEPTT